MSLETMNQALRLFGLQGWKVVWDPDPSMPQRGECFPEVQVIIVYDEDSKDALETLLHEALEVKMRPLLGIYRETINQLIELLEKVAYREKEVLLGELIPFMLQAVREGAPETTYPEPEVEP